MGLHAWEGLLHFEGAQGKKWPWSTSLPTLISLLLYHFLSACSQTTEKLIKNLSSVNRKLWNSLRKHHLLFIFFSFPTLVPGRVTEQSHFVMQPVTGLKAGKTRKEREVRVVKNEEISQDPPLEAWEDVNTRSSG